MRVLFDARPGDACATGIGRYARTIAGLLAEGIPGHQAWSLGRDVRLRSATQLGEELELPSLLEREEIDVFHSPMWKLPALLPCQAVVTIHDAIPVVRPDLCDPAFARLFDLAKAAADKADAVVCPSEHARQDVTRVLALDPEIVHVVPETPELCFQRIPSDESRHVYTKYGITGSFVLIVGSLEKRKNPAVVLDALARLERSAPLAVFAGPDAGFPLMEEAEKRGVGALVRAVGRVSDRDLAALLNEATALVFPSLHEGFGLPVVEAFACDAPVIASSATSVPEVAGDAAVLFDPTSAEALADALDRVFGSPRLRDELAMKGRARLELFSRERVRAALAGVYSAVEARRVQRSVA